MTKAIDPVLIITVTQFGVSDTKILYRTLAEEKAGRELQAKCSTIISLLSEVARSSNPIESLTSKLPIDLDQTPVTHATSQTHHPRS